MIAKSRKSLFGVCLLTIAMALFSFSGMIKADEKAPNNQDHNPTDVGIAITIIEIIPSTDAEACNMTNSHLNLSGDGTSLLVFTSTGDHHTDDIFVAEIAFKDIRAVTDDERAKGESVWITSAELTSLKGWHVDVYWTAGEYGVQIVGDEPGASCDF